MSRFYNYRQLIGVPPAPAPVILGFAAELSRLPAFASGHAVLAGSVAWGRPSWRSDIDLVGFKCAGSQDLESDISAAIEAFERGQSGRYVCPRVDIVWVGAEREELVERDNLVSNSAPIKEPLTIAEVFERVCVRFVDHLNALARVQGDPWQSFVARHLPQTEIGLALRRDVMREYVQAIAVGWRAQTFHLDAPDDPSELDAGGLEAFGNLESFAYHFVRQVLGERGIYPAPDRRGDVRDALSLLGDGLSEEFERVLNPLFALGDGYEALALRAEPGRSIDEGDFYRSLRRLASAVDIDAVEQLVWRYVTSDGPRSDPP